MKALNLKILFLICFAFTLFIPAKLLFLHIYEDHLHPKKYINYDTELDHVDQSGLRKFRFVTNSAVNRKLKEAVIAINNYDRITLGEYYKKIRPYFTEAGFAAFRRSFEGSFKKQINSGVYQVTFTPQMMSPAKLGEISLGDERKWFMHYSGTLTVKGLSSTRSREIKIFAHIVETSPSENPAGIAIDSFISN